MNYKKILGFSILIILFLTPSINSLLVGGTSEGYYNGILDDLTIFNRELFPDQITYFFNNQTNILANDQTLTGQSWSACATPNDGFVDGNQNCTISMTILGITTVLQMGIANADVTFVVTHTQNTNSSPMVLSNQGTADIDVTLCANAPLFPTIGLNTSNFQANVITPAGVTVNSINANHNLLNCTTPVQIINNLSAGVGQLINVTFYVFGNKSESAGVYNTSVLFMASAAAG
ncbi:hypothetical protein HOK68_00030 [Candidatus Woesearchaeota archaeon]|jgi:hypothetical protein|nr:hypothetical protein [Candidatus Woesearchaeota archaeon]MBT4387822.1 hypothetical protein [Candidatus Woesearchaeota archaeon]MBT4595641.1 hypothetical protein [Candidatus Woesearchaeota archaeon]MBT5740876.1 hypothetical protein [Candidatus Woesearchaeota archaeon]MBT6505149.1 hypothetical protein [Candidatus Woesearchaeota archaeon]